MCVITADWFVCHTVKIIDLNSMHALFIDEIPDHLNFIINIDTNLRIYASCIFLPGMFDLDMTWMISMSSLT